MLSGTFRLLGIRGAGWRRWRLCGQTLRSGITPQNGTRLGTGCGVSGAQMGVFLSDSLIARDLGLLVPMSGMWNGNGLGDRDFAEFDTRPE